MTREAFLGAKEEGQTEVCPSFFPAVRSQREVAYLAFTFVALPPSTGFCAVETFR